MANYSNLIENINQNITENGQGAITGLILNQVLRAMVTELGEGYQLVGVALPNTTPIATDSKIFYLASTPGTYTNFNGIVVPQGISILKYNGSWGIETLDLSYYTQVQANWNETNPNSKAYIQNKPELNQQYVYVSATAQTTSVTDVLPATGDTDTIYRVSFWNGSAYNTSVFSEYAWNGSAYVLLDTRSISEEITSRIAIISGKVNFTFGDSSFTVANPSAAYFGTVQGDTLRGIASSSITINDMNAHYLFVEKTGASTGVFRIFRYDQRPSGDLTNYYYIGMIFPLFKKVLVNIRDINIDGVDIDVFTAIQKELLSNLGTFLATTILPTAGWKNKSFNNASGTDGIFFDLRNEISASRHLTKIGVIATRSGKVHIHFLSTLSPYTEIASEVHNVVAGTNEFTPTTNLDYSQNMYVAFSNDATNDPGIKLIYPTDNTGQTIKIFKSDGHIVEQTYPYALWITTVSLGSDSNNPAFSQVNTLNQLKSAVATGGQIFIGDADITLDATLNLNSGTKITGVRGKSIIRVPASVLKGFEFRNKEDIIIENITLIGAYNGTPLKNALQPVKSGIVDSPANARDFVNANYQTDLTNGGVTSVQVPQIGINIYACEKVEILGCEIKNFSNCGICNGKSGQNYRYACKFERNYINNCYCGIKTYNEAERSQYIANNISLCQIGLYCDSGTNMFTDNAFSANRIGLFMGNGWNNAHDVHTGNAYTHCSLFSIYAYQIEFGAIFSQCKVGYCDEESGNDNGYCVILKNSRGIFFDNCQLINAQIKIDGKFSSHGASHADGSTDIFGNTPYVVTYETVSEGNGGITRIMNASVIGYALITWSSDLNAANVILKNNYYITGADNSSLNN